MHAPPHRRRRNLAKAGLVTDITSKGLDQTDWLPNALATAQNDGKLFGVPFRSEAIALVSNKDVFQAAGLDPETPPATWDDWLRSMRVP